MVLVYFQKLSDTFFGTYCTYVCKPLYSIRFPFFFQKSNVMPDIYDWEVDEFLELLFPISILHMFSEAIYFVVPLKLSLSLLEANDDVASWS